jgi:hypothetical protein
MDNRKFKYAVVRNITGDSKLAQTVRSWSNERIFLELNIVIPSKEVKLSTKYLPQAKRETLKFEVEGYAYKYKATTDDKTVYELIPPKLTKKKRSKALETQDRKIKYAVKKGLYLEDAVLFRFKTYKQLEKEFQYKAYQEIKKINDNEKKDRVEQFREWAKEDDFPPSLVRQARLINLQKNLDINDSYGFS